jgi:hypothetical protein
LPTGSYTNAGCPSPDQACSDPDWSTTTATTRYLGDVAPSGTAVFAYSGKSSDPLALDGSLNPPGVPAASLEDVLIVTFTDTQPSPGGSGTTTRSVSVPVTGNVYQSTTSGNG